MTPTHCSSISAAILEPINTRSDPLTRLARIAATMTFEGPDSLCTLHQSNTEF